ATRQRHAAAARVRHRNTAAYNSVVALATKLPVRHRRRARIRESIDRAAPVLNSRQRLPTSAWRRDSAVSVADQLRLPYRALRSVPAPCAEIRLPAVQSSHPYGRRNPSRRREQADQEEKAQEPGMAR